MISNLFLKMKRKKITLFLARASAIVHSALSGSRRSLECHLRQHRHHHRHHLRRHHRQHHRHRCHRHSQKVFQIRICFQFSQFHISDPFADTARDFPADFWFTTAQPCFGHHSQSGPWVTLALFHNLVLSNHSSQLHLKVQPCWATAARILVKNVFFILGPFSWSLGAQLGELENPAKQVFYFSSKRFFNLLLLENLNLSNYNGIGWNWKFLSQSRSFLVHSAIQAGVSDVIWNIKVNYSPEGELLHYYIHPPTFPHIQKEQKAYTRARNTHSLVKKTKTIFTGDLNFKLTILSSLSSPKKPLDFVRMQCICNHTISMVWLQWLWWWWW